MMTTATCVSRSALYLSLLGLFGSMVLLTAPLAAQDDGQGELNPEEDPWATEEEYIPEEEGEEPEDDGSWGEREDPDPEEAVEWEETDGSESTDGEATGEETPDETPEAMPLEGDEAATTEDDTGGTIAQGELADLGKHGPFRTTRLTGLYMHADFGFGEFLDFQMGLFGAFEYDLESAADVPASVFAQWGFWITSAFDETEFDIADLWMGGKYTFLQGENEDAPNLHMATLLAFGLPIGTDFGKLQPLGYGVVAREDFGIWLGLPFTFYIEPAVNGISGTLDLHFRLGLPEDEVMVQFALEYFHAIGEIGTIFGGLTFRSGQEGNIDFFIRFVKEGFTAILLIPTDNIFYDIYIQAGYHLPFDF